MPRSGAGSSQARRVAAFGESKSIWQWSLDKRCFLSSAGLAHRIEDFPRELTEEDVEAAMCLPPRMWRYYREHGAVPQEMLDELDDGAAGGNGGPWSDHEAQRGPREP
jgi:hypothetical protein